MEGMDLTNCLCSLSLLGCGPSVHILDILAKVGRLAKMMILWILRNEPFLGDIGLLRGLQFFFKMQKVLNLKSEEWGVRYFKEGYLPLQKKNQNR